MSRPNRITLRRATELQFECRVNLRVAQEMGRHDWAEAYSKQLATLSRVVREAALRNTEPERIDASRKVQAPQAAPEADEAAIHSGNGTRVHPGH